MQQQDYTTIQENSFKATYYITERFKIHEKTDNRDILSLQTMQAY